jgi:hypothetical protein
MTIVIWNHHRWELSEAEYVKFIDFWKLRGECRVFKIKGAVDKIEVTEYGLKAK